MADFDLTKLTPHQVSRNLKGYIVFFYGDPKSGKTTTAVRFPKTLLLAFEKGYNAIPGVMAQPINSWGEFKKALKQLASTEVQNMFDTIIVDTADIAYDYCEKYVCNNYKKPDGTTGVDSVADIPYGKGYGLVAKEYDECLRKITQLNYGLVMISHSVDKTFTDEAGKEYNQIVPTLDKRARNIVSRMADIIGYSRAIQLPDNRTTTKLFMRGTPRYIAGSRFKYTPDYIDFSYDNLVNAIGDAIDKQAQEEGNQYFTNAESNLYIETTSVDFDFLKDEFFSIIGDIQKRVSEEEFGTFYAPRITQITDKYLGRGNLVKDCSREQTEALDLIVSDLKDLAKQSAK